MAESTKAAAQPSQPGSRDKRPGDANGPPPREAQDRIVRARLIVASSCALITLAVTLVFFTVMSAGVPVMSRVVLGRSITLANVLGVGIIVFYVVTVLVFERLTSRAAKRSFH